MSYTAPNNDNADFDPFISDYTVPSDDTVDIQAIGTLSPPSNVHFNDTATEDQLTLDWDTSGTGASGYYVYRSQSSGTTKSDYTQVADVTGPPYTDTALEDGERYYYRVSSHD